MLDQPHVQDKLRRLHTTLDHTQIYGKVLKPPAKYTNSLREHYHSAPLLTNNTNNNLLGRQLPRPVHPSTVDFSRAMTKLDLVSNQKGRLGHS